VQVPNERDDASTIKIELELPQVFAFASFQDVSGWNRTEETVEFDEPIEAFGEEVTEGIGSVTWEGAVIGPGEFERFAISVGPVPTGPIEFKAIQTYDSGEVVRWIGPADSDEPAPVVNGIDLGVEEGQGQLAALADIKAQLDALAAPEEEDSTYDSGSLLLPGAALVVSLIALLVAFTRKRTT
ncbi:MAG TPA: YcnI family protein, partial [Actinomycetota bacterium]|nr:YcnI family protein [Actinomycetota bacterium]